MDGSYKLLYEVIVNPDQPIDHNFELKPLSAIRVLLNVRVFRMTIRSEKPVIVMDRLKRAILESATIYDDLFVVYDNELYIISPQETVLNLKIIGR